MDDETRDLIANVAERHALLNAVQHEGIADPGAVIGAIMADEPAAREHGDDVPGVVAPVVERVNDLALDEQRDRLAELDPDALAEVEADDEETDPLGELSGADAVDQVRMRVAPNPNAPWHLGHARMGAVVGTYAERHDGWFACRFDDTDPVVKRPDLDAYDAILDDLDYLGFEPDRVVRASDRVESYYEAAHDLIDAGRAYACACGADEFSQLKNSGEACPHRDRPAGETRNAFETMVSGDYDPGDVTLRVKTDIDHPNPAVRDWVAFRMVDRAHPRPEAAEYRCWPTLDFQSAIDDHRLGITHVIRGIDLQDSAKRQRYVYDAFGWEYPDVTHWGRIEVDAYDVPLSASTIRERIEAGDLDGWDDPRAPTVASLRRRGIRGGAITDAMIDLGTSTSNVDCSMSSIYAHNRERVDDDADRYFLVRDALEVPFAETAQPSDGAAAGSAARPDEARPPVHPEHEERGRRTIPVGETVLVEADDYPDDGNRVWLKGYGCVRNADGAFAWTGDDIDAVREEDVPVIHWVPARASRAVRLRTMEGDVTGHAEPGLADAPVGDVVQFERVGFARIDRHEDGEADRSVAYFAHR
jgi:glutamyl-tRNA synthetase